MPEHKPWIDRAPITFRVATTVLAALGGTNESTMLIIQPLHNAWLSAVTVHLTFGGVPIAADEGVALIRTRTPPQVFGAALGFAANGTAVVGDRRKTFTPGLFLRHGDLISLFVDATNSLVAVTAVAELTVTAFLESQKSHA